MLILLLMYMISLGFIIQLEIYNHEEKNSSRYYYISGDSNSTATNEISETIRDRELVILRQSWQRL